MKSLAHENRQMALLFLVSELYEGVGTPINVVQFCLKYNIDAVFFDALRELDCLTLLPVGIDEVMRFNRTGKLLSITVDEVLQAEKRIKPGKSKLVGTLVGSGTVPETPDVFTPTLPDEPVTVSPKRINKGVSISEDRPLPITKQIDEFVDRFAEKTVKSFAFSEIPAKEAQRECKGMYGENHCDTNGCSERVRVLLNHDPSTKLPGTMPLNASNAEAAAHCVNLIIAHCGQEPTDQNGLVSLIVDQLRVRQIGNAKQLREEAAPILSRAEAFERAAQTTF